jgi:hypothetical protein
VFQYFYEGQYKGVSTVICYMLVWSRVWTPARARDFVFSIPVQTNPGTDPASTTMSTGALSREWSSHGMALTTHPHLAPRLWAWEATQVPCYKVAGMKWCMI